MSALSPEEKQRIYEEEKARMEAQENVKNEASAKTAKLATKGCLGCLGLIAAIVVIGALVGSFSTTTPTPPAERRVGRGEQGKLVNGVAQVLISRDDTALKALQKAGAAKDQVGYTALILSGQVFSVPANTKVLVLNPGVFTSEVRVLEGPQVGKSGLVAAEFVKP